jgi:hypothetical protein
LLREQIAAALWHIPAFVESIQHSPWHLEVTSTEFELSSTERRGGGGKD